MQNTNEPAEVGCTVGSYQLIVSNSDNKLRFQAYSETLGRLFEEELTNDTLSANLKDNYGECSVVYELIEHAVAGKQVMLSDSGELRFSFMLKMVKTEVKKEISVMLK
jgi:hypothetical protein